MGPVHDLQDFEGKLRTHGVADLLRGIALAALRLALHHVVLVVPDLAAVDVGEDAKSPGSEDEVQVGPARTGCVFQEGLAAKQVADVAPHGAAAGVGNAQGAADRAAATVAGDEVARAHFGLLAAGQVAHHGAHAAGVLLERHELGSVAHIGHRLFQQPPLDDGLQRVLADLHLVVRGPGGLRNVGAHLPVRRHVVVGRGTVVRMQQHAAQLGGEDDAIAMLAWQAVAHDFVIQTQPSVVLHRSRTQQRRPRVGRRLGARLHEQRPHTLGCQVGCQREPDGASPDDQYGGLNSLHRCMFLWKISDCALKTERHSEFSECYSQASKRQATTPVRTARHGGG